MIAPLPRLRLLATDGLKHKKIMWMETRPNGLYIGWSYTGIENHFSYHTDGNAFWTFGDATTKTATLPPLKNFKDMLSVFSFSTSSVLTDMFEDYTMSRADAAVYFDVREFAKVKCDIGCMIFLVEPHRFDMLNRIASITHVPVDAIHVFMKFTPWIVLVIHKVKTDRFDRSPTITKRRKSS